MTDSGSDTQLSQLSDFVEARMGLHFPKERWRDLAQAVSLAARDLGFNDTESTIQSLIASPLTKTQVEILASHLTVGETYFFREKRSFEILEELLLPELIRRRQHSDRRIRIWSAGCCTGEEPYSIAMVLSKIMPDRKDWNITVLATDINPRFLQKASQGVYGDWSFRDTPVWVKDRYFKRTKEGRFEILPHIKKIVTFSYLNLAEDAYPSLFNNTNAMDVIFCRNVLMYFTPKRAKKVIQNLYRSVVDSGWLIVSPSETSQALYSQFATVNFPGAILYKKGANAPSNVQAVEPFFPRLVHEEKTYPPPEFKFIPEQKVADIFLHASVKIAGVGVEKHQKTTSTPITFPEIVTLFERGFYAEVEEKIIGLPSQHLDDARLMALLARVYANQGKLAEAQVWSQKANTADKLNPAYRYLLATILLEQGHVEDAVVSLRQALYLDQNYVLAYFALGNLAHQRGKANEAQKHFHAALALLGSYREEETLPESEGITAGRLTEIIRSITNG